MELLPVLSLFPLGGAFVLGVFGARHFWPSAGASAPTARTADPDTPCLGLEDLFPVAARTQRAMADRSRLRSTDPDTCSWLRHAAHARCVRHAVAHAPVGMNTVHPIRVRQSVACSGRRQP
jgi:hypothetical protein